MSRNCIIDMNARIGKNVVIANKDVGTPLHLTSLEMDSFPMLTCRKNSFCCRGFRKQIGHVRASTYDLGSQ